MDQDADLMVTTPTYEKLVKRTSYASGVWGSDVEVLEAASLTKKIVEHKRTVQKASC